MILGTDLGNVAGCWVALQDPWRLVVVTFTLDLYVKQSGGFSSNHIQQPGWEHGVK